MYRIVMKAKLVTDKEIINNLLRKQFKVEIGMNSINVYSYGVDTQITSLLTKEDMNSIKADLTWTAINKFESYKDELGYYKHKEINETYKYILQLEDVVQIVDTNDRKKATTVCKFKIV